MNITVRNITIIYILALTAAMFAGCVRSTESGSTPETSRAPADGPGRIVSLSPNLTQIIFALGADEYLVAVDEYSNYPPAAMDLPRVGNYLDPDLEALASVQPDLVLIVDTDEGIGELLSGLGLEYMVFGNNNIDEILESIFLLGELLDRSEKADELTGGFFFTMDEVSSQLAGLDQRSVALVVGRNPGRLQDIYVAGPGSYLGEIIILAGGTNAFADQPVPWPQIGTESLVGVDPDVIIDSTLAKGASDAEFEALLTDWDDLPALSAVQNDRVIIARKGWFQIPGAHLDSVLMLFAHWIHPEVFPDDVRDPGLSE